MRRCLSGKNKTFPGLGSLTSPEMVKLCPQYYIPQFRSFQMVIFLSESCWKLFFSRSVGKTWRTKVHKRTETNQFYRFISTFAESSRRFFFVPILDGQLLHILLLWKIHVGWSNSRSCWSQLRSTNLWFPLLSLQNVLSFQRQPWCPCPTGSTASCDEPKKLGSPVTFVLDPPNMIKHVAWKRERCGIYLLKRILKAPNT